MVKGAHSALRDEPKKDLKVGYITALLNVKYYEIINI